MANRSQACKKPHLTNQNLLKNLYKFCTIEQCMTWQGNSIRILKMKTISECILCRQSDNEQDMRVNVRDWKAKKKLNPRKALSCWIGLAIKFFVCSRTNNIECGRLLWMNSRIAYQNNSFSISGHLRKRWDFSWCQSKWSSWENKVD